MPRKSSSRTSSRPGSRLWTSIGSISPRTAAPPQTATTRCWRVEARPVTRLKRTQPVCQWLVRDSMSNIPDDVFTEPEDFSADTLANLGPLRRLAGVWQSDQGVDINPKAEGPERRVFSEHIRMEPIDPQTNGPQLLYGLRHHIHINTPQEPINFQQQVGHGRCV